MIEPGKIVKSGGHCYGSMGEPDCAFWKHSEKDNLTPEKVCPQCFSHSLGRLEGRRLDGAAVVGWLVCRKCGFKMEGEVKDLDESRCLLFGNTEKDASLSLVCCDRIYGKDYEGRP